MQTQLPNWCMVTTGVQHYDPLIVNEQEVDVLTWKHLRFAYQHGTPAAWLPSASLRDLASIDVVIGPLHDICEIVLPKDG